MSPKFSLHVMRIVKEATTNCIKHVDCEKMILATGTISQDEVYVDIIDYGKGMELQKTEIKNQRRGISNMFYRASANRCNTQY
jgi:signal transduction histidine kinase